MATFHSGKNSTAFFGSSTANIEVPCISWDVQPNVEIVNFRNSKTGRYSVKEATFLECDFSVKMDHDFAANPYLPANGGLTLLGAGGTVAARLYLNGTSGAYWDFPQAIVKGNPQSAAVEGKVENTVNLTASGAWFEPNT